MIHVVSVLAFLAMGDAVALAPAQAPERVQEARGQGNVNNWGKPATVKKSGVVTLNKSFKSKSQRRNSAVKTRNKKRFTKVKQGGR